MTLRDVATDENGTTQDTLQQKTTETQRAASVEPDEDALQRWEDDGGAVLPEDD